MPGVLECPGVTLLTSATLACTGYWARTNLQARTGPHWAAEVAPRHEEAADSRRATGLWTRFLLGNEVGATVLAKSQTINDRHVAAPAPFNTQSVSLDTARGCLCLTDARMPMVDASRTIGIWAALAQPVGSVRFRAPWARLATGAVGRSTPQDWQRHKRSGRAGRRGVIVETVVGDETPVKADAARYGSGRGTRRGAHRTGPHAGPRECRRRGAR